MDIQYVIGDATQPAGNGPRIIAHICNDIGGWGRGFVTAISRRWPEPEKAYRRWFKGEEGSDFALGRVQFVAVASDLWVANIIGQHGIRRAGGRPPIRYDAVREGLARVAEFARAHYATVHMPRIGAGLAGGDWDNISRIIEEELIGSKIAVTVYDLSAGYRDYVSASVDPDKRLP